jgi:hypothetical protein
MGIFLTFLMALSSILFVYNTDRAQSLTDLLWYIGQRGLPVNLVGLNLGTINAKTLTEIETSIVVQPNTMKWNGTVNNTWDGLPIAGVLRNLSGNPTISETYSVDCVIASTLTPSLITALPINGNVGTLSGYFALLIYLQRYSSSSDIIPNGRLGYNATDFDGINSTYSEVTCANGLGCLYNATAKALLAEKTYNVGKPLLMSKGGGTISNAGSTFQWTQAYLLAAFNAAIVGGASVIIDLGDTTANYFYRGGTANDFVTGVVTNPPQVFGFCVPANYNDSANNPISNVYYNNMDVVDGAWCCIWYSDPGRFTKYFLYKGASAGVTCAAEPLSNGLRDPLLLYSALRSGLSFAECMPVAVVPMSNPQEPVANPARTSCFGDPLYAPYLQQELTPVAGQPWV